VLLTSQSVKYSRGRRVIFHGGHALNLELRLQGFPVCETLIGYFRS